MSSSVLLDERDGRVRTLVLNRPDAYNALNVELRDLLVDALRSADADGVGCVVIRANGRGFCAGVDLKEGAGGRHGVEVFDYMRVSTHALVRAVLECSIPVVTAVHGVCAGVALVLALAADHCIASTDARFSAPFVKRALVPDGATTYLLPRLVGTARAKRMLLFGEDVTAAEALSSGMIGEVTPADDLVATALARADELAALPLATLRYTKSMLQRSFELDVDTVLFEERAGQALISTSPDFEEGRNAFLERRPPRFGGSS